MRPTWCFAWPGEYVAVQPPAAAEVNGPALLNRPDPVGRGRGHLAEEPVERAPVHHPCAGHQAGRVGQVTGAAASCTTISACGYMTAMSPAPPA